jgi:hypothetical protein
LAEQQTLNLRVEGSIPSRLTIKRPNLSITCEGRRTYRKTGIESDHVALYSHQQLGAANPVEHNQFGVFAARHGHPV